MNTLHSLRRRVLILAAALVGVVSLSMAHDTAHFSADLAAVRVGQDREAALFELSGKARLLGRVMGLARNEARGPTEFGDLYLATTNGDRLYILYALRDYDEISSRGTFTIVGGTGRFSNASGGGVMTASAIEGLPYYPITLDGTISF